MDVYKVDLSIESPLVITDEQVGNILRHSGNYIRGKTLRGAFLSFAYRTGNRALKEELINPEILFHPAYPVKDGMVYKPAHPLTFSCKICGKSPKDYNSNPYEILRLLESGGLSLPVYCEGGHPLSVSPLRGALLNERGEIFSFRSIRVESIGINRFLKSSEVGMLYSYVALPPGLTFRSYIVDMAGKLRSLGIDGLEEIWIGRGVSRGLGKARVSMEQCGDIIDKEKRRIEGILQKSGGRIVLRALSQVFSLKLSSNGIYSVPFPEIKHEKIVEVRIDSLNGNAVFTRFSEVSGFSMIGRLPIPKITGADAGSIFFYRVPSDAIGDVADYLARSEFIGFGPFSSAGFNILEVMDNE